MLGFFLGAIFRTLLAAVFCCGALALAATDSAQALVGTKPIPAADSSSSLPLESADTLSEPDSAVGVEMSDKPADSVFAPKHYRLTLPQKLPGFRESDYACREQAEIVPECLRGDRQMMHVSHGFPGTPNSMVDIDTWQSLPWASPYQPAASLSPYGLGGLRLPDSLRRSGPSFSPFALGETWSPIAPLDTPLTRLQWQRGAFAFNQFQVDLERALIGGSYVALSYASLSADSQFFDYSFNVHQPYLSGWGFLRQIHGPIDRDSASLVLTGIAPGLVANHMRPRLGFWLDTSQVFELFYDRVRNRTNLGLPRSADGKDSILAPYGSLYSSDALGLLYGLQRGAWHFSGGWVGAGGSRELQAGLAADSNLAFVADETTVNRLHGEMAWSHDSLSLRLWAMAESETLKGRLALAPGAKASPGEGWRDGEAWGGEAGYAHERAGIQAGAALRRESRASGAVHVLPEFWAQAQIPLAYGFQVEAGGSARREDPPLDRLYRDIPSMNSLASPGLKPRWDRGGQGVLAWNHARFGAYFGYTGHWVKDAWAPEVLPLPSGMPGSAAPGDSMGAAKTLPDSLALRWSNYDEGKSLQALVGLRGNLGHWRLWLENRYSAVEDLSDDRFPQGTVTSPLTPARVYRGGLAWNRRLVSGRMRLITGWDWEWISARHAWAANLDGTSSVVKLDEYLVLDFYAAMQIKTFVLHFRAQNMNHDRYAPSPGAHPPGVNFRFGIDWALFN